MSWEEKDTQMQYKNSTQCTDIHKSIIADVNSIIIHHVHIFL
jgi:hypothetical protein